MTPKIVMFSIDVGEPNKPSQEDGTEGEIVWSFLVLADSA